MLVAGNIYDHLKGDAVPHQDLPFQPGLVELFVLGFQALPYLGLQSLQICRYTIGSGRDDGISLSHRQVVDHMHNGHPCL
jgi:hypothetical protein